MRPIKATQPDRSPWNFPPAEHLDELMSETDQPGSDLIALGADLEPGTLLAAYQQGYFPMPVQDHVGWFSPAQRGILWPAAFKQSRSLRRSRKNYTVTINKCFFDVIQACATTKRDGAWIDNNIIDAYIQLHEMGWCHSAETWDDRGRLVGGLYGVGIGGFFAGESMFHWATDASKVALAAFIDHFSEIYLLDVQWVTPHLLSLGATEIERQRYLTHLKEAVDRTKPFPQVGVPDQAPLR